MVRPPGHHAGYDHTTGYCIFNNVAVAVKSIQQKFATISKVCIFDWDLHFGNGTSELFYDDPSVLVINIHKQQSKKFKTALRGGVEEIGTNKGLGYNINFPFPAQTGHIYDYDYIDTCETLFFPVIRNFQPDIIFISCGFDSALGDVMKTSGLTPFAYSYMLW